MRTALINMCVIYLLQDACRSWHGTLVEIDEIGKTEFFVSLLQSNDTGTWKSMCSDHESLVVGKLGLMHVGYVSPRIARAVRTAL